MRHADLVGWLLETGGIAAIAAALILITFLVVVRTLATWEQTAPRVRWALNKLFGPILEEAVREKVAREMEEGFQDEVSAEVERQLRDEVPGAVEAEVEDRMSEYDARKAAELQAELSKVEKELENKQKRAATVRETILQAVTMNTVTGKNISTHQRPTWAYSPTALNIGAWERNCEDFEDICGQGSLLAQIPHFFERVKRLRNFMSKGSKKPTDYRNERARDYGEQIARHGARILSSLPREELEKHLEYADVSSLDDVKP